VQPPRLLAAAVDPQNVRDRDQPEQGPNVIGTRDWDRASEGGSGSGSANERSKSASPPGLGTDSPRKLGRNRTDTMVFSDTFHAVEEFAKAETNNIGTEGLSILERHEPAIVSELEEVSSPEEAHDVPSSVGSEQTPSTPETPDKYSPTPELLPAESSQSVELIHLEPENPTSLSPEDYSIPHDVSPPSSTVAQSFPDVEVARPADEEQTKERDQRSEETTVELSSVHPEPSVKTEISSEVDAAAPLTDTLISELDAPSKTLIIEPPASSEKPAEVTIPAAEEMESDATSNLPSAPSESAGTVSPEPQTEIGTNESPPPTVDDTVAPDVELETAEFTVEPAPAEVTEEGKVATTGNVEETEV